MSEPGRTAASELSKSTPTCIADRYDVLGPLGRGGMAMVHRVRDRAAGDELAVKRLSMAGREGTQLELFEREFHTLTQLAHPRIVRAYDYGFDGEHAFYTMELLDGGDLRELAPLPWQEVCSVAYDICSALSLLHSRRLVHLDLTPRNVRRTADGKTKLIDFGLMAPFGPRQLLAGTPPYVAPEVISGVSVDGRSDLFSLGATLYQALTGRVAFKVRRFEQLWDAWRTTPPSPRQLLSEIPQALDQLVMALLRIDIGSRPRSASEVMDRIAPLLSSPADDSLVVASAHLAAPELVGRTDMRVRMRKQVLRALRGRGGGFLVSGARGAGRTRALDTFVLEAKLNGALVARAHADDAASGPLGAARALVEQIHRGARAISHNVSSCRPRVHSLLFGGAKGPNPPLVDITRSTLPRAQVQATLAEWILTIAHELPLALVLDDLELSDEPSAALVAALTVEAPNHRLSYAVSACTEHSGAPSPALAAIRAHARNVALQPLSSKQTARLLTSVFGDVPNVGPLSRQLHELSTGRPRECMLLAQHLVDQGIISYSGGAFCLPPGVDADVLPKGLEGALRTQLRGLSRAATRVGRLLSLAANRRLNRGQLRRIGNLSAAEVDAAIGALQRIQAVAGTPYGYRLCHPSTARLLLEDLEEGQLRQFHDQLANAEREAGAGLVAVSYHALQGATPQTALRQLVDAARDIQERTELVTSAIAQSGLDRTARTYRLAYEIATSSGDEPRLRLQLQGTIAGISALGGDGSHYDLVANAWLAWIKLASGHTDWSALVEQADPAQRALQAFVKASERHAALPDGEWLAAPADAIKELVAYAAMSIAIAARTLRPELSATLPTLLEPFVPLSPVVNVMRLNAEAALTLMEGRREEGRARYLALVDAIDAVEGQEPAFMGRVRAAVCQAIATQEATLGIHKEDPDEWLRGDDPSQRVGSEYVRKIMALHRGEWELAEQHRRNAELIALQHDANLMFVTLSEELEVHTLARDLTGTHAVRARISELARQVPAWGSLGQLADLHLHHLCGEYDAALELATQLRETAHTTALGLRGLWAAVSAVEAEIYLAQDRVDLALEAGMRALERAQSRGHCHLARTIAPVVALAEARLGRYTQGVARIEGVLDEQAALGVSGLLRGRSLEYLARCAMHHGDHDAFDAACRAVERDYRPGCSEVLGALYERLIEDARRIGLLDSPTIDASKTTPEAVAATESTTVLGRKHTRAQAMATLAQLRDAIGGSVAHLYLLTETGLTLTASTGTHRNDSEPLLQYAKAQLEIEQDDAVTTVADGLAQTGDNTSSARVQDAAGRPLHPISLVTQRAGGAEMVGVLLVDRREVTSRAAEVITAITRRLIGSGAYRPISLN